ncbi:Uncharacterised protein [Klebsiella pneumoniae]|nr:Uncharacterised protein [Klebsiella pneumoniae]SWF68766.1 Uncharacterised protein [Klebsiella pneumoniae]SWM62543.1 Uncharacterised protein [Klebsiella pneumoniae]
MTFFAEVKGDIARGNKSIVQVDIDAVSAGRYLLSIFKVRQIRH